MKDYRPEDLAKLQNVIWNARDKWRALCEKNLKNFGDTGTIVMGAGIAISYIPPRCRYARSHIIIHANEVSRCQGALNWETNISSILDFLRANGVDAYYEPGRMD